MPVTNFANRASSAGTLIDAGGTLTRTGGVRIGIGTITTIGITVIANHKKLSSISGEVGALGHICPGALFTSRSDSAIIVAGQGND